MPDDGFDFPIIIQDAHNPGDLGKDTILKSVTATTVTGTTVAATTLTVGGKPVSASSLRSATVAASAAIANTDTVFTQALTLVPASTFKGGSRISLVAHGTMTSAGAAAGTFTLRAGTAGTTADASVATAAVTSATTGTSIAFEISIDAIVQTLGASGTCFGSMRVTNTGVTGIAAVTNTVVPFTSSTLATTTATALEFSYISGASGNSITFQDVHLQVTP